MATYFVASGGSNTSPYDTWAKAATSLATALAAASTANDIVVIQKDAVPSGDAELASDTTYTFANNILLISATNGGGSTWTPSAMSTTYWVGNSTTNRGITLAGAYRVYIYGITFRTAGSSADNITLATTDGSHYELDNVYLWSGNTAAGARINVVATSAQNSYLKMIDCTVRFGNASQGLVGYSGKIYWRGGSLSSAGTAPTTLFIQAQGTATVVVEGVDLSATTGTLVGDETTDTGTFQFINCKLGSSFTALATQTVTNKGSASVELYNCAGGDTHYNFAYYDALGQVEAVTNITATDAAANNKYDGTNRCSWKIVTTANASFIAPFVTPWFETYHSGTSAITPSIEVMTDGSSTALKDDEIWGEWSYQGTSGFPLATFVNDRRALEAAAANQTTSSLGAGDWSGEGGTNWYGKLAPASSITPAEIGMLRARVCVGKASTTVYVDPTNRYS